MNSIANKMMEQQGVIAWIAAGLLTISSMSVAEAVPVTFFGQPVQAIGSSVQSVPNCPGPSSAPGCYTPSTGEINYFIPINRLNKGVYGVTDPPKDKGTRQTGTFSDIKRGRFDNPSILTMYLRFSPLSLLPLASAHLTFNFGDLDLIRGNDPSRFSESIRIFNGSGTAITPLITTLNQYSDGSPFPFIVSGGYSTQTIDFPDIKSLITNDPFFLELNFSSKTKRSRMWRNTPETLTAILETTSISTPEPVPEPGTLLLLGSGLVGLGGVVRRKKIINLS